MAVRSNSPYPIRAAQLGMALSACPGILISSIQVEDRSMATRSGAGATNRGPAGKQAAKQPVSVSGTVARKAPAKEGTARKAGADKVPDKVAAARKAGAKRSPVKRASAQKASPGRKTPAGQTESRMAPPKTPTKRQPEGTSAGGSAGFRGYLYQAEVSVWAALDLVLAKGMASAIEVEPASHEDVEAWLTGAPPPAVEPTDPGRTSLRAQVGDRALVIQAKFTETGDWSHTALARLLDHGGPERLSAKDRLQTPNLDYLLITSGPLTGVARGLSVREFTQKLEPSSMAASLVKLLPAGAAGRVKVIEAHDEGRITLRLRELLVEAMKVPLANREACLAELRDVARAKMTGREKRTWTRDEMAEVIERHAGYLATSPDITQYIRPENWSQLCDKLDREHAVIIYGRSGTGKTMTAAALWDHLHNAGQGHQRIVADRPSVVRETSMTSPVVFDIEDPWGKYQFEPGQEQWLDRLPHLLRTAGANRKFIITTREDVMMDSGVRDSVKRWMVSLQPDNYSRAQKRRMYDDRILSAPRDLQIPLARAHDRVLTELSTPNEIDRFFANLRDPDESDRSAAEQIAAARDKARHDFIELTIVQQVRGRREQLWAVVVWALLGARKKLTRQVFVDTHALLAQLDDAFEAGLDRFLNFFIAGRTLRQSGQLVSYYHPRAEAALAAIAREEPIQSAKRVARLLDALTRVDVEGGWGAETAAFVLAFVARSETLVVHPSALAQAKTDDWIRRELATAQGEAFRDALRVAAAAGSPDCRPAEFARFVLEVEPVLLFSGGRKRPERSAPEARWFAQMRGDASVRALCRKWVETALPNASEHYLKRLVERLRWIEPNIASSFIRAMDTVIRHGVVNNGEVIAAGAVLDLEAVTPVLTKALDELESPSDWDETWQKIADGLYSEGYAQHLSESAGEEGYTAGELVDEYVAALRRTRGWHAIASHPQARRLGRAWARLLPAEAEGQSPTSTEEVRCLLELGIGNAFEDRAWDVAAEAWDTSLLPLLVKRVAEPIESRSVRESVAVCMARSSAPIAELAAEIIRSGNVLRLIHLFEDLKRAWGSKKDEAQLGAVLAAWGQTLPSVLQESAGPFLGLADGQSTLLPEHVLAMIAEISPATKAELQLKIRILLHSAFDVRSDIQGLLDGVSENEVARFAMRAAAQRQLTDVMEQALSHPRGVVRAEAFRYLAARCESVLPQRLVALHDDESRYVREAVAEALARDPRPQYLSALEKLAADTWSDEDMGFGPHVRRPIARIAAAALAHVAVIDGNSVKRFFELASRTDDTKLRSLILLAMVRRGSAEVHNRMLTYALRTENSRMGTAVAQALLGGAEMLDTQILGTLDPEQLLRKGPEVAAQVIVLLGLLGPEATIDKAVSRLVPHPHRKVLLVLLARVCQEGFPGAAAHIRLQLPGIEALEKYLAEAVPLPPGALDVLGDALTVKEVEDWLAAIDKPVKE
jgi:hypothetical protein